MSAEERPSPPVDLPLTWPPSTGGTVTVSWVKSLGATLDWASRWVCPTELPVVLPVALLDKLLLAASTILHGEPNCVHVIKDDDAVTAAEVVVVGDLHGQLHDLLLLLSLAGLPAEDKVYVFNGDYVDRGAWGLEIFVLLLAWKVLLPHRVFLLRGNHESKYCTSVYGFEKEVMTKYGNEGQHVYRKCLRCFEDLPLASIIANTVFTTHGGLFRSMNIARPKRRKGKKGRKTVINNDTGGLKLGSVEELMKARRTVLDPPWEGMNLIPGDVLWSDPSMKSGLSPNYERGIGLLFGPDCTDEFLRKHGLKLIIRSHEGPDARTKRVDVAGMDDGYTIDHVVDSGKLITLFSAPDYPQFQATQDRFNNKGAYIVLRSQDYTAPEFHTFEAVKPRPKANPYYDFEDVVDSDEDLGLESMAPPSESEEE